jgi:uncharacterized protein YjbJ (UPF0337 family)
MAISGYLSRETHRNPPGGTMSLNDKMKNAVDEAKGKVKEAVGRAGDDDDLKHEGQKDQVKANLKDAADQGKDDLKQAAQKAREIVDPDD